VTTQTFQEPAPQRRWRHRFAVAALLGAFNLVLFNRYFPLSEGWWETYGYLYNSGLRPYRDFDLAYTPLFTIVNAGLLRVFGDSFFALRLFGVAVFLVAVLALQAALDRVFSARTAAVATLASTVFMISQPQFIAKDYHVYQLGLVSLALLAHLVLADAERHGARARVVGSVLLGATVCLVFVLKQNVGALLLAAFGLSVLLVERERPGARALAFAAGAVLPLLVLLPIVTSADWRQLLLSNDAKGDMATVLLRFWHPENRSHLASALPIFAVYLFVFHAVQEPARWRSFWRDGAVALWRRRGFRLAAFLVPLVIVAISGNAIRRTMQEWIIPLTLAVVAISVHQLAVAVIGRRPMVGPLALVGLPLLALAYANTTTAAFDVTALQIPVAFAIGYVLSVVQTHAGTRAWALVAAVFVIVVPELVAAKLRHPYQWWGHVQAPISAARSETAYPQLAGIYVGPSQARVIDAIKQDVDRYSRSRKDVFFFNVPVLYWLHGKLPPFRTVVHWFDVISSRQMNDELRALEAAPPRLVVALEPPPRAFKVHRVMKNQLRMPQEDFWSLMDRWVAEGRYRMVRSVVLPSDQLSDSDQVTQEIVVEKLGAAGLSPLEVKAMAGDVRISFPAEDALAVGDVVAASGTLADVRALSEKLGIARGAPRDWNTLNVYVRVDAL
jgi:4-amino-4-deoxy-L-arabinose transferase-like glycosyltransferase